MHHGGSVLVKELRHVTVSFLFLCPLAHRHELTGAHASGTVLFGRDSALIQVKKEVHGDSLLAYNFLEQLLEHGQRLHIYCAEVARFLRQWARQLDALTMTESNAKEPRAVRRVDFHIVDPEGVVLTW